MPWNSWVTPVLLGFGSEITSADARPASGGRELAVRKTRQDTGLGLSATPIPTSNLGKRRRAGDLHTNCQWFNPSYACTKPSIKCPQTTGLKKFRVGEHTDAGRVAYLERVWKLCILTLLFPTCAPLPPYLFHASFPLGCSWVASFILN